jgi:isocitrate lyase
MHSAHYQIDNKGLEGFIKPFVEGTVPCVKNEDGCADCRWCEKWLDRVLIPDNRTERLEELEDIVKTIKREVIV